MESEVPGRAHPNLRKDRALLGFPSVAFLDAEGKVLLKVGVDDRTISGLHRAGRRAHEYKGLRERARKGDATARAPFLLMQLEEMQLEYEGATKRREQLPADTSATRLARIDELLVDLSVSHVLRAATQESRYTLGPRFLRMLREGPQPTVRVSRGFWYAILEWAERERDAKAFREGLEGMRAALVATDAGKPWVAPLLDRYTVKLRKLERARQR